MIRLVQRKLIIPCGDTGTFSIAAPETATNSDVAVFSIFNCLTHQKLCSKEIAVTGNTLNVSFTHEETAAWQPGNYVWDIKFYKNPHYNNENELDGGDEIDSYYAGYTLPECEIRPTGENWPMM